MITVKEIAQICNVSPSTVSNILNGKSNVSEATRERVLDVVKETGYQPNYFAQSIRKQSNRMIALITEDLNEFSAPPIVESAMAYCEDHGYRTILMNLRMYDKWKDTWYSDDKKLKAVLHPVLWEALSIRVDGIIYVAGHCREIDCLPEDLNLPVVFAYGVSKNKKYPSVIIDDEKGGYDAMKHLTDKGHKKIGIITGTMGNLHAISRLEGCKRALKEKKIEWNPRLVYEGNWRREAGYTAAEGLIKEGVTAIFCMNDNIAAGVYDYLYEQQMTIGKDISVVGYDNKEIAEYLKPQLTTNEIQLGEIGKKAGKMIIDILSGREDRQKEIIKKVSCKLIERNSVQQLKQ